MREQLLLLLSLYLTINAASDVKPYVTRLEARYRSARTLQASFLENYSENGRLVRAEAGTAYFRRPGKMRWEYESPEKNLFLVDGKTAWFYVPADHTATRVPAKRSADWRTPLALLAGEMKLSRFCATIQPAANEKPETSDNVVLSCKLRIPEANSEGPESQAMAPHTEDMVRAVLFEVVRNTGELVRVLVQDPGGVTIEFHFANWVANPPVDDSIFQFHPPPGVAIVNGELPPG